MQEVLIAQCLIIVLLAFVLKAIYQKGRYDERREDIRLRQANFDSGSQLEQGLRSCREASELNRKAQQVRDGNDSQANSEH